MASFGLIYSLSIRQIAILRVRECKNVGKSKDPSFRKEKRHLIRPLQTVMVK